MKMSMRFKRLKLKIVQIRYANFRMRVWSNICDVLARTYYFCSRNKMYKTSFAVYSLHKKAFAIHDIRYRNANSICDAVLKEMEE